MLGDDIEAKRRRSRTALEETKARVKALEDQRILDRELETAERARRIADHKRGITHLGRM